MKTKWWLNFALFGGFIATFFVDFFGIEIHQWLGMVVGGLAVYHLVDRWVWVAAVSQRFFGGTSSQARRFYVVDAALFAGFTLVTGSGLLISTWLKLSIAGNHAWLVLHILVSILTLLVLLAKLVLHTKWIEAATRSIFSTPPTPKPIPISVKSQGATGSTASKGTNPQQAGSTRHTSRREFLQVMGVIIAASLLALDNAIRGLQDAEASSSQAILADAPNPQSQPSDSLVETGEIYSASSSASSLYDSSIENTSIEDTSIEDSLSEDLSLEDLSPGDPSPEDPSPEDPSPCYIRCSRACSYPGYCRRYVDANQNNHCDLGECL